MLYIITCAYSITLTRVTVMFVQYPVVSVYWSLYAAATRLLKFCNPLVRISVCPLYEHYSSVDYEAF